MKARSLLAIRRTVEVGGVKRSMFVASTATPDRYGDIVDQATWKLDNYRANPVVQVDHDYRVESTVGRGLAVVVDGVLTLEVEAWGEDEHAQAVRAKVEAGIVNAVSVGFRPGRSIPRSQLPAEDPRVGDRGYVFYDCELLEISIVAIPANPEALASRSASLSLSVDELVEATLARIAEAKRLAQPEPLGLDHLFTSPTSGGLAHLFRKE